MWNLSKKSRLAAPALVVAAGLMLAGCASTTPGEKGAIGGGAIGAGTGAIIGAQSGNAATGALIGGAVGAISGGLVGRGMAKSQRGELKNAGGSQPPRSSSAPVRGHYETRIVRTPSGETYEERVWVPEQ